MAGILVPFTENEMDKMSFLDLVELRKRYPDKASQNYIAPYEHKASVKFAMEQGDGAMAGLMAAAAAPYNMLKVISPSNLGARSDPSMQAIGQGMMGFFEGIPAYSRAHTKVRVRKPEMSGLFGVEGM